MNTLICLASRQTMPNVIPVLMYKPQQVIVISTEGEKDSALYLSNFLTKLQVNVKVSPSVHPYDQSTIENYLNSIQSELPEDTVINLTGGTKLMALAAFNFGVSKSLKCIYCDTANLKIHTVIPTQGADKITGTMEIEDYLSVHGYNILEAHKLSEVPNYIKLFEALRKDHWFEFLSFVKKVRSLSSQQRLSNVTKSNTGLFGLSIETKGQKVVRSEFTMFVKNPVRIVENNPKSLMGTWLEYYLAYILYKKTEIDPLIGCKVESAKGVNNEIDVMLLKDYKLHLFSCKSGSVRYGGIDQGDKIGNDALYQIDTLKKLAGGTFGKGYLAISDPSYRGKKVENLEERSKDMGVKLLADINAFNSINL